MKKQKFNDVVKQHFNYLIVEYGFLVKEELTVSGNPLSRGMVTYMMAKEPENPVLKQTLIRIILDRGYVLLEFGSKDLESREYFSVAEIVPFVASGVNVYEKIDFSRDPYEIIETQVKKLSDFLLLYCIPFLKGDFSIGDRIFEHRSKEREERIQKWKKQKQIKLSQNVK